MFLFVVRFGNSEISCLIASASMMGTESSSEVSSGGGNNPFTIIHNDEIEKSITVVKLNGANYPAWSKSIKVVLMAKKKLKFLLEDPSPRKRRLTLRIG